MELPVEVLTVFFQVMDDFSLFGKLSILSKEAYRYSQLHKKSFADRMSRNGYLPNGTEHGEINVQEGEFQWSEKGTSINERWEYGKVVMRLYGSISYESGLEYENDLYVYSPEGENIYHLAELRKGTSRDYHYTETIGQVTSEGYIQESEAIRRFRQPYEVAIQTINF